MSMAAKLSDLVNRASRVNLQMDSHTDMPSQSAKDLQESEALGSSPSYLPSWSPARRLPSSCPNMKHCLEIHVTLTEELGAVPPPSHSLTAPLVEDMLCDIRTSLTKAVVTGPGRAVLFYVRCSMGEDLTTDEARDATFLLTGAGMWVEKLAYLAVKPMTIQESWWAIAQAVTDCQVKVRGPGHPHVNLPTLQVWPSKRFPYKGCVGCRDCTLLSYTIRSLQGYPGKLVQSSSTDITLDDVLTILDEQYNNVKVLDALNQELFQYGWWTKRLYQTGMSIFWDISRFWLLPFPTAFPWIEWKN